MSQKKIFITTPIYYVNAKPHLGHFYSTLIADVTARYQRQSQKEVFFLTGTDEHGQKIQKKAQELGLSPQELTDQISDTYKQTWQNLNISHDFFIRTTQPDHKACVQFFMQSLKDNDYLYEGTYQGLYCLGCESFKKESDLTPAGLCPDHLIKPELLQEKNWFFKLSQFKAQIISLIEKDTINIIPQTRKHEVLNLLKNDTFEDLAISRPHIEWGIKVPFDPEQTVYVWVDALINYLSAIIIQKSIDLSQFESASDKNIQELINQISFVWPPNIQVLGKDILKFHAIIWPALLLAFGFTEDQLPKELIVTGFWLSGGKKMSKSLDNSIDPVEIAQEYNQLLGDDRGDEVLRYFLLREIEIGQDGDITKERIMERYESDLANGLGNTVSRVVGMKNRYFPQRVLSLKAIEEPNVLIKSLEITSFHKEFQYAKILEHIWAELQRIDIDIEQKKVWEKMKTIKIDDIEELNYQWDNTVKQWMLKLYDITEVLYPFMPKTSQRILEIFQGEPKILFPKIYKNK